MARVEAALADTDNGKGDARMGSGWAQRCVVCGEILRRHQSLEIYQYGIEIR
jgi:hypothetical protein